MSWEYFILFAIAALVCWALGAFAAWKGTKTGWAYGFTFLGLAIFFSFIIGMWISLERPPMRTMGETRLWYSFFLPLAGLITYARWKYKWILSFSCILSLVFICINIFKPEIHNKTLMPALQSPWFAPHVIVYMFAYAMLGAATVMAVYLLWFKKKEIERKEMDLCDNLTYVGLAFMTLGMLTGAIWAKEAWGHYQNIERSIIKKFRKEIWRPFIEAVQRYELVNEGDKIAVCISGGKDSMLMAKLMQELQRHSKVKFEQIGRAHV